MTMPLVNRKDAGLLHRRNFIAERYRDGMRLNEIAKEVSVSRQTVWSDLRWVHEQLLAGSVADRRDQLIRELQQLDWLESEATEAWDQSKLDAQSHRIISEKKLDGEKKLVGTEYVKTQATKKGQCGDPRFLAQIADCVDKRCKLFGLYAPEKRDVKVSVSQRREKLANIAQRYSLN